MTQLTAAMPRAYRRRGSEIYQPIGGDTVIYEGAACTQASSGNFVQATGLLADPFGGFAARTADNTGGGAGTKEVILIEDGDIELDVTGVTTSTLIGTEVFADDSNTFTLTPSANAACRIGVINKVIGAGKAWVSFKAASLVGNLNRAA